MGQLSIKINPPNRKIYFGPIHLLLSPKEKKSNPFSLSLATRTQSQNMSSLSRLCGCCSGIRRVPSPVTSPPPSWISLIRHRFDLFLLSSFSLRTHRKPLSRLNCHRLRQRPTVASTHLASVEATPPLAPHSAPSSKPSNSSRSHGRWPAPLPFVASRPPSLSSERRRGDEGRPLLLSKFPVSIIIGVVRRRRQTPSYLRQQQDTAVSPFFPVHLVVISERPPPTS